AEGELELMSPSPQHEDDTSDIERLLTTFSDETGVELACARSRTLKREETQRGAEADTSYFVGRRRTGFPDIVIEVLWTQPLLDKLDIYWNLGIREVWLRRRSQGFSLFVRGRNGYARHRRSRLLADLDLTLLAKYVGTSSPTRAAKAYRAALRKSLARRRN
ncbi:MAG: Uma2 family endonuclease, partial [Myxococcota bacterium]